MGDYEFKTTKIEVLGFGAIGKKVIERVSKNQIDDLGARFIDKDKMPPDDESTGNLELSDEIQMLILVFDPHEHNDGLRTIIRNARLKGILIIGITRGDCVLGLKEKDYHSDLVDCGIDSLFCVNKDEMN